MSKTTRNAALAVAGLASVFAVGQTVANAASYTVQKDDTLSEIASKFNLTVDDLISTNKISDKNMIFTNQKLEVSNAHSETPANSGAQTAAQKAAEEAKDAAQTKTTTQVAHAQTPVVEKTTDDDAASTSSQKTVEAEPKQAVKQDVQADVTPAKTTASQTQQAAPTATPKPAATKSAASGSGSTYDQFIANGGTDAMWQTIVQPESGGNPNAVSANGYTGLGQTKESWGSGSVADQTKGMVNYATSRYGSVEQAVSFRQSNGWW